MSNHMDTFPVGTKVIRDTFEGLKTGTVTAVGAYWVEVDGYVLPSHAVGGLRVVA